MPCSRGMIMIDPAVGTSNEDVRAASSGGSRRCCSTLTAAFAVDRALVPYVGEIGHTKVRGGNQDTRNVLVLKRILTE